MNAPITAPLTTQPEIDLNLGDYAQALKGIAIIGLATALIFGVLVFASITLLGRLGYSTMVVSSGSMEPNIGTGDIVIINPNHDPVTTQVGDVITYTEQNSEHTTTHRVIDTKSIDGTIFFRTQGDANATPDPNLVAEGSVFGKVVFNIPMIGFLIHYSTSPWGKALLFGLPAVALGLREVIKIGRHFRQAVKEEMAAIESTKVTGEVA